MALCSHLEISSWYRVGQNNGRFSIDWRKKKHTVFPIFIVTTLKYMKKHSRKPISYHVIIGNYIRKMMSIFKQAFFNTRSISSGICSVSSSIRCLRALMLLGDPSGKLYFSNNPKGRSHKLWGPANSWTSQWYNWYNKTNCLCTWAIRKVLAVFYLKIQIYCNGKC